MAEVAGILGTTKGAVKLRAHRAYQALRGLLRGELAGERGPREGRGDGQATDGTIGASFGKADAGRRPVPAGHGGKEAK